MSICWSSIWLLQANWGNVVIKKYFFLFYRACKEDEESPSKCNMLILLQLVNHYVNLFYLCCANGCASLWWNVECCPLQRKKNQEHEWWDIIVEIYFSVICWKFVLMLWCYFVFGFFFRSDHPGKISRWVICEVSHENYHIVCNCVYVS